MNLTTLFCNVFLCVLFLFFVEFSPRSIRKILKTAMLPWWLLTMWWTWWMFCKL
jgi:hypothetical protein